METQIELSTDNGGTGETTITELCFVYPAHLLSPPELLHLQEAIYLNNLSDFAGCTSNGIWYLNITDDTQRRRRKH